MTAQEVGLLEDNSGRERNLWLTDLHLDIQVLVQEIRKDLNACAFALF